MGSSTGKKQKKEKKHKHRSRSESESVEEVHDAEDGYIDEEDEAEDGHSRSRSHSRHHSKSHRGSKQYDDAERMETIDVDDDADAMRSRKHKHKKHKEHKERHKHHRHHRDDRARQEQQIIAVEGSDTDSSDCVEVPLDAPPPPSIAKSIERERELVAPPPPQVSKQLEYERREREQKDRERDRDREREREKEQREREKEQRERERERERERDRERYERERYERERNERDRHERERHEREREMERRRERDPDRDRGDRDREREKERERERERHHHHHHERRERGERDKERSRSKSPIPENGAGDCLSIEETNKLRAKLGLKPLEMDSGPTQTSSSASTEAKKGLSIAEKNLSSYKDEWGEFLHKPADNLKDKAAAEKMRDKLKQRKEKRFLEERLAHIRTLGESDDEVDDISKWVERSKRTVDLKKEAEKRAKALEEMDAELGVDDSVENEKEEKRRKAYNDKHLKGLRVEHDMEDFSEGKTVILTLKDKDVLDEEDGDTLVNVNMIDDERYRKNVENKKMNPLSYGYNVYEEQYDELGNPIERSILEKYDEDLDGKPKKKKNFVIGESLDEERENKRRLLEIKTKLAGKRLETLADTKIQLASDTLSETELAKFKKPKKKVKKLRQRLKAEDLLPLAEENSEQHLGSRRRRTELNGDEPVDQEDSKESLPQMKIEDDEEEDLQRVLSKARKLKQKENIIKKPLPIDIEAIKDEIKMETPDSDEENSTRIDGNIVLNATAEFCRTLGDIPTYGMAGNRDEDSNDMMDFEVNDGGGEERSRAKHDEPEASTGTWNSVDPEDVMRPMELDDVIEDVEEVAILDEEPDVGAGVANALRLALSKGYLEKEEHNRPSNTKMAHLQAKNYSIEDKTAGEDDKFGRRDRFHAGPIMDFRDKDSFKPNVKLEYIDDNGRILSSKEAFRYLSHKFHGKGPGKNKIEKRLKKMEQEGLMKTMSSTDTPLGTLTMLQQKQKETKAPYVVLSGGKQTAASVGSTTISKYK